MSTALNANTELGFCFKNQRICNCKYFKQRMPDIYDTDMYVEEDNLAQKLFTRPVLFKYIYESSNKI